MRRTNKPAALVLRVAIVLWTLCVLYASFVVPPLADPNKGNISNLRQMIFRFGFNQLHLAPLWIVLPAIALCLLLAWLVWTGRLDVGHAINKIEAFIFRDWKGQLLLSLLAGLVFWLLRSNYTNKDFILFKSWYSEALETGGILTRFDEMWEAYLNFIFHKFFSRQFGFSINRSFQLFSVVCGVFFFFILLRLVNGMTSRGRLVSLLMICCGGFMQLFFGDMESYTLCGMLVFCYLYTAMLYIKGRAGLALPALALMAAMTAHMAAIFLVPSLLYLFVIELQKRRYLGILTAGLVFFGMLSFTLLFFAAQGVSLQRMVETSWGLGRGGSIFGNMGYFTPEYFWGQINLIGLIFPPAFIMLPQLFMHRQRVNHWNIFLLTAAFFGVIFFFLWTSTIGLYMDWNLFSLPLIPLILLLVYNLNHFAQKLYKSDIVFLFSLSTLMTYIWIISNHLL